jgi:hypothetical protein
MSLICTSSVLQESRWRSNVIAVVEGSEDIWIVHYPDGKTIGNFENQNAALHYVQRFGR